jgi:hypothetical protein
MGKYNYTNRVELFWNIDDEDRDVMVMVQPTQKIFYIFFDVEKIKSKINKNFIKISEESTKIFCEIYRGAFRKEIQLGNLLDPLSDQFNNESIILDERIDRSLNEIDPNSVVFRLIISDKSRKILATSNSITPFFIGQKEDITKIRVKKNEPLFGTKIDKNMQHLWDVGFENEENENIMRPVIYLNEQLHLLSDMEIDDKLSLAIFSFGFKELLRRCFFKYELSENKYIQNFLHYAEIANDKKVEDIHQQFMNYGSESENDQFFNEDLEVFLNNALEKYLEDIKFLKRYADAKKEISNETNIS